NWTASRPAGYTASEGLHCILVKDNNIFLGTHTGGVYTSTDTGISWTKINNGLGSCATVFAMTTIDDKLYIATECGIFKRTVAPVVLTGLNDPLLQHLLEVFNDYQMNELHINLRGPMKENKYTGKLFNILGQKVGDFEIQD